MWRNEALEPRGPRAPPAPAADADPVEPTSGTELLDSLAERGVVAALNSRHALAVTLYGRAVAVAGELQGELSLCRAYLLLQQGATLIRLADVGCVDKATARTDVDRAWAMQREAIDVLEKREADGTMMPGLCKPEEAAFYKKWKGLTQVSACAGLLTEGDLDTQSRALGFGCFLDGARAALHRFFWAPDALPLPPAEAAHATAFVLRAIDYIPPAAKKIPVLSLGEEKLFATTMKRVLQAGAHAELRSALRARWTNPSLRTILRARGLPEVAAQPWRDSEAARVAGVAKHGLRECGLPRCDKREVAIYEFRACGGCKAQWYCSMEHQMTHWKEHKALCKARA